MYANHVRVGDPDSAGYTDSSGIADLRKVWTTMRRRWRVIVVAIALCMALTAGWLFLATPIYTASTTLLIEPRKTNTVKEDAIVSDLQLDANTVATEVALIKSFGVFRRVAEQLKLKDNPLFQGSPAAFDPVRFVMELIPAFGGPSEVEKGVRNESGQAPVAPDMLDVIRSIEAGTSVQRVATTYFMQVSFAHESPELSATIANAVASAYLDEQLEARFQAAQRAATWLNDRVATLRAKLETSERALADHRARNNLAKPEAGSLAEQQASEINAQLVSARAQIVDSKAKYEQAQRVLDGGAAIESLASIMNSPAVGALRAQETAIAREQADLQTRYGPEHPAMLKIRAQHSDILRQIKREIARVVQTLKADHEFAQQKEESLARSLKELTGSRNASEEIIIRLRELERDAQTDRALYEATLARFKEAEQQISLKTGESRIVEPAFIPDAPNFPNKGISLVLAMFGGMVMGLLAIGVLEFLENGFTEASQIEQALGLSVLAMVPMLKPSEQRVNGRPISVPSYLAMKPQSRYGESVRSARLLTQMSAVPPPKIVLITSSTAGEGKTTMAMSMAYSAAVTSRQRVLLLDCDLRARSATKQLNLGEKQGLTDLLHDNIPLEGVIYQSDLPNLDILPAGTELRSPQALLESKKTSLLLTRLRDDYDMIYVDTPPLLPVIDTTLLLPMVDRILFLVSWRKTPRAVVQRATQLLTNFSGNVSGVVVNNVMLDRLRAYDPSNTYHHKSYAGYYTG